MFSFARTLGTQMIRFTIKATKNDDTPGRHQQRTPRRGTSKGQGDDPQTSRLDACYRTIDCQRSTAKKTSYI